MIGGIVVQILYNIEGEPRHAKGRAFDDVQAGAWYYDSVSWASANGIVSGYGNGNFGADDFVTREQFAVILFNYAKWKKLPVSSGANLSGFTDVSSISGWALDAMKWSNAEGLILGRTDTTLVPSGTASRAEAAAIFQRFLEGNVE